MDVDDSGYLSKEEVSASFERLGKPLSDDELDKYMQSVDVDGNGEARKRWDGGGSRVWEERLFV
jgi:Ca2+-binding EF-hand superfamily protein